MSNLKYDIIINVCQKCVFHQKFGDRIRRNLSLRLTGLFWDLRLPDSLICGLSKNAQITADVK